MGWRFPQFRKKHTDWVEESFLFENTVGKQIPTPSTGSYVNSSFFGWKVIGMYAVIAVLSMGLLLRTGWLQIAQGKKYEQLSVRNRERLLPIPAERGLVYDRNDVALTKNIPNFSLAIVPQDLPRIAAEREQVIGQLAEITGTPIAELRETIDAYRSYRFESIVIAEDIPYETALLILARSGDLPGISIERGSKRLYAPTESEDRQAEVPDKEAAYAFAHVLGYVGKLTPAELDTYYEKGYLPSDSIGKTGVERSYEASLRGIYGRRRVEVNAYGREQSVISEEAPVPGAHIRLTIDKDMQLKLYEIIKKNLTVSGKQKAAGIAMDPRTGEILALVNIPAYDNNDFSGGIDRATYKTYIENPNQPLFPRAWSGTYPSGSSIKPAVAAAALAEGIISDSTSFLSAGGLRVSQWFFPDWQAGGHGVTNVRKSLAWSVNTFYYYIGGGFGNFVGLGVEKMTSYMRLFGFAEKLGLDIPGEVAGFLPSKEWKQEVKNESWYIGDTYNVSIGQGDVLVTPLQIAAMTSAIANGGTLFTPHVVKDSIEPVSKKETRTEWVPIRENVVPASVLRTVRLGMRDCVIYGSCRSLSALPVLVAGKTGTAQWNTGRPTHAWFTSFAPFDAPEIAVTILVEEGGEGSAIAAPIAKEFYAWWAVHKR